MKKLSLAYFGSPNFAADFLEKILLDKSALVEVNLVVTQPDRKLGRKQLLTSTPVKQIAQKNKIEVFDDIKKPQSLSLKLNNIDLGLIYYYGQIIHTNILKIPKYGFWNIHFSALPKLRGPTPATFSLILGEKKTAVSFVQTDKKLDHGNLIVQQIVEIGFNETRIALEEKLHNISYKIFAEQINNLLHNKIKLTPQDHAQATYTRFPVKDDGYIPFIILQQALTGKNQAKFISKIVEDYCKKNNLAISQYENLTIYDLFRGLYPWPGIWTMIKPIQPTRLNEAKRLKITDLELVNGKLIIKKVQLEGKHEVDFETFNKAYQVF